MTSAGGFNILAFVVSVLVYFVLGFFWYSNALFAKPWAAQTGVQMGGSAMPIVPMAGQLIATILSVFGIYMVVMLGQFAGLKGAFIAGISVVGFFIVPLNSGNLFFKNKPVLFWIEAGYQTICTMVAAVILTLWK